jgi:hypothetical protein
MTARAFAAICAGIYIVLGIAGFVPALWQRPVGGPPLTINVFYASLLGVFTVNIILSMMHLVIGLWGAMAANNRYSSLVFARAGCIVFVLLGVLGLIPVTEVKTLWGTVPLHGNNVWLHFGSAAIALIFSIWPGYQLTQIGAKEEMNPHLPH